MGDIRGRYLWYELVTTDPGRAKTFYGKVMGWTTVPFPGTNPYDIWQRGETGIGGVMELPAEARAHGEPSRWLAYIGTPDVDRTVKQAESAGAKVYMPPTDIPTVGRFAVLADPDGVVFAVFTPLPGQERPAPAAPQIGDCSWHEINAADPKRSWDFFSGLFGWEKKGEGHDMGPAGVYQEYGLPGEPAPVGGIYRKPAENPAPPHIMLYFRVADVARSGEVVKANGGQVLHGPVEVPGGDFISSCMDPTGAAFSLHHTPQR
jgi:predicted enzyme related to lactoylglutathione lyase